MPSTIRPPAASDPPGLKKLGRYECTEQVGGSGGFETYRARVKGLTGLDRSFAVKVLRLKRSEVPSAVSEPFLQAARRSAALADPHIAKVVEADSGDGLVFAVTPFMEGTDLGQFLQRAREAGVLATGKDEASRRWHGLVAYIGAEIARGLQAAHAQEPPVMHGALCPGNVFITTRGAVRLLDFGLRASVRRPFEPRPRRLLPYIAPELAAPAADGTTAGDMYSLGVLLCELSSGELPPQGRRASEMQIALSLLPEDLGLVIGRLVSASPGARPTAADVVSSLAAVYAGRPEAVLAADLSSLVQRSSTSSAAPEQPPEAVVSLAGAPEAADDAPPPPSDVEHDDDFGFEESLHQRTGGLAKAVAAGQPVVRPVPPPAPPDESRASRELTAVGEPAVIADLVAKSRPAESVTPARIAKLRLGPPPVPGSPVVAPATVPSAAPAPSPANRARFQTLPAFGPKETAAPDALSATVAAAPAAGAAAERLAPKPPLGPSAPGTPASAPPAKPLAAPAQAPSTGEAEPFAAPDAGEVMAPGASAFDPRPSTWGARALAALGGQAGIGSSSGSQSAGLALLDDIQAEAPESVPLAGSPPLRPAAGQGGPLRSQRPFALDEPQLAEPAPADDSSMEAAPDFGSQSGWAEPVAADIETPGEVDQPRGDGLLEDELVDSPDGVHPASSYDLGGQATGGLAGQPLPEAFSFVDDQPPSAAEAVAFREDGSQPPPEAEAYVDVGEGGQPAAAPAYFEDAGQPLPESEIHALPEASAPRASRPSPPVREAPAGGVARGAGARRPAREQESVPTWAQSPDAPAAKQGRRRMVWTIAASVLGASIVVGGLAGFFVGTRGQPSGAAPGGRALPALPKPKAVAPPAPAVPDDVEAQAAQPSDSEATSKPPGTSARRTVAAVEEKPSAAKKSGSEKPLKPTTAGPSSGPPAPAPSAAAPSPSGQKTAAAPSPSGQKTAAAPSPDKKVIAAGDAAPTTWSKGVSDGGGSLVMLSVTSQPVGAAVWISGKERGRTPLQVRVQSGPTRVVLVLAGHASATVDVRAGEDTQVSKDLVAVAPPMTGEARFRAECITQGKLPIVVDGKETGILCPFNKLRVDPGVHKIGLFVPALGKVHEKEVTLQAGVRSIVFGD
ncbi:MAG: protein kinase [Polyangia bacterium]|jgi:serine/threonine-protein kinase